MRYSLSELVQQVNEVRGKNKRVEKLKEIDNQFLRALLDYTYNPNIKWIVPYNLEYKPCDDSITVLRTRLYSEMRKLHYFTNKTPHNLPQQKLEDLFRTILEIVHPDDAKMLNHIIQYRSLPGGKITPDMVIEAFPQFRELWEKK